MLAKHRSFVTQKRETLKHISKKLSFITKQNNNIFCCLESFCSHFLNQRPKGFLTQGFKNSKTVLSKKSKRSPSKVSRRVFGQGSQRFLSRASKRSFSEGFKITLCEGSKRSLSE